MGIEDNFELLLKEKNHKQIIVKLDGILKQLMEEDAKVEPIDISGIEVAISKLTINKDINKIPLAIKAMTEVIVKKMKDLTVKQKSEWVFDISRDSDGLIKQVNAKGK